MVHNMAMKDNSVRSLEQLESTSCVTDTYVLESVDRDDQVNVTRGLTRLCVLSISSVVVHYMVLYCCTTLVLGDVYACDVVSTRQLQVKEDTSRTLVV